MVRQTLELDVQPSLPSSNSNLLRQNHNPVFDYQQNKNLCEHGLENSEKAQDLARIIMLNYSRFV
jgi:hypothetical protein